MTESGDVFSRLRRIVIAPQEDPVSLVAEDDARRAWVEYPRMCYIGPIFGTAEHVSGLRWKVIEDCYDTPQQAREGLAHFFRVRTRDTDDPALREEYQAAYTTLESEKVDELTAGGKRVRVIRIERIIRARQETQEAEPPRPTDPDPLDAAEAKRDRTAGFVLDPDEPSGWGDAAIREHLLPGAYPAGGVPADVRADSMRALDDYPGGVLLPVEYAIGEKAGARWNPVGETCPTPTEARRQIAEHLRFRATQGRNLQLPAELDWAAIQEALGLPDLDEATRQAYLTTADEVENDRDAVHVTVPHREFQIIRVMRLVRYGSDGPEPPRPSDPDPEPPIEALAQQDDDAD